MTSAHFTEETLAMPTRIGAATLVLSIDVEPSCLGPDRGLRGELEATCLSLLRFCVDHEAPGVWAFSDPANSELANLVHGDQPEAELALVADPNWAGGSRSQFVVELSRRTGAARSAGIAISTLVVPKGGAPSELDLLVKYGVCCVRTQTTSSAEAPRRTQFGGLAGWLQPNGDAVTASRPRALRWGLWETPVGVNLVGLGARRGRGTIDAALGARGTVHARIDVPALIAVGRTGLRGLDAIIGYALNRRDQGLLRIETTSNLVSRLMRPRQVLPAQSILHRRAA